MKILHSKITGTGNPILILHGFLGMGDNWKTHADKLAKDGFEVHSIDQRNHGRSFHSSEFNYNLMINDLKKYIEFHNIKKTIILGHSMGGKTAMLFAVKYPQLVDKLIVADIAPKVYPAHHNAILKALNSVDFSVQNSRKLIDEKLSEFIKQPSIRNFLTKSLYRIDKNQFAFRFNLKSLSKNYEEIIIGLPSQTVYDGKTLFLSGEKSAYITEKDKPLIKSHFPNARIEKITAAGHWLHAENPKGFYLKVIEFLHE